MKRAKWSKWEEASTPNRLYGREAARRSPLRQPAECASCRRPAPKFTAESDPLLEAWSWNPAPTSQTTFSVYCPTCYQEWELEHRAELAEKALLRSDL